MPIQTKKDLKKFSDNDSINFESKSYSSKFFSNIFWKVIDSLACKSTFISNKYENIIGKEYKEEYKKFKIPKYKKVLHIGCGTYPLTEITLSDLPGKEIFGIDKNPKAVVCANKLINKKGLETKITIKHGNGIDFPISGFDFIIISSCSHPKEKILENIFKNADKNCFIILREIDSAFFNIMDLIGKYENIEIVKKIRFKTHFLISVHWYSAYLTKNK